MYAVMRLGSTPLSLTVEQRPTSDQAYTLYDYGYVPPHVHPRNGEWLMGRINGEKNAI
jgi:hypothetical protein